MISLFSIHTDGLFFFNKNLLTAACSDHKALRGVTKPRKLFGSRVSEEHFEQDLESVMLGTNESYLIWVKFIHLFGSVPIASLFCAEAAASQKAKILWVGWGPHGANMFSGPCAAPTPWSLRGDGGLQDCLLCFQKSDSKCSFKQNFNYKPRVIYSVLWTLTDECSGLGACRECKKSAVLLRSFGAVAPRWWVDTLMVGGHPDDGWRCSPSPCSCPYRKQPLISYLIILRHPLSRPKKTGFKIIYMANSWKLYI